PVARAADRTTWPQQMPSATSASAAHAAAGLASAATGATASIAHAGAVPSSSLASHDNAGAHRLTVAAGRAHLDRLPALAQTQAQLFQRGEVTGTNLQGQIATGLAVVQLVDGHRYALADGKRHFI